MRYLITLMTLFTILLTPPVLASGRVPFGHQLIPVQNYSRATEQIAISGMIGDGGVQALVATGFKTVIYALQMKVLPMRKLWSSALA